MSQSNNYFKNFVNNHKFIFATTTASLFLGIASLIGINIFSPAKRPFYSVKSFNLINNSSSTIEKLDIKYKVCDENKQESEYQLKEIESLTVTKIFLWNGGRIKIDKTDVDNNPITIVALGTHRILEAKEIHISNSKTNFKVEQESKIINFHFLDSSNGGVIQVIHTGSSDEDIALDGYVEDSKFNGEIRQQKLSEPLGTLDNLKTSFALIICIPIMFLMIISFNKIIKKQKVKINQLKKKLSNEHLSQDKNQMNNKNIEIYKNHLQENIIMFRSMLILFIFMVLSGILTMQQLFLERFILRYPSSSYEVFNSEITVVN